MSPNFSSLTQAILLVVSVVSVTAYFMKKSLLQKPGGANPIPDGPRGLPIVGELFLQPNSPEFPELTSDLAYRLLPISYQVSRAYAG